MTILLDIGNTNTSINLNGAVHTISTATIAENPHDFLSKFPSNKVVFASVVPKVSRILIKEAENRKINYREITIADIPIPINIHNPQELGVDRAINACMALNKYKTNVIVVDFGTALTFDVVYKEAYQGGMIFPGITLAMNSLHTKTAKLPNVIIHEFQTGVGKNTVEAITFGACIGYIGILKETLDFIKSEYDDDFKIVFTGGSGRIFYQLIKNAIFEENLILEYLETHHSVS